MIISRIQYALSKFPTYQSKEPLQKHGSCIQNKKPSPKLHKTGNVRINVNSEARSRNHCYGGKAISISSCECVSVALVTQHTKRMRRTVLSPVACLTRFAENNEYFT